MIRLISTIWRRRFSLLALVFALQPCIASASLNIVSHYSPRNRERPVRRATDLIILHTTEGPKAGSLNKLHANGEAHYMIDEQGKIYRIIHRNRVAFHAGRSMWDGRTNLDNRSIGIEIVGYHNRDITAAQYAALRELLAQLQRIYRIPDERVMPHSMVAYGAPNRWHRQAHRGRKRCGMQFARADVRRRLGLGGGPARDPDVAAGRLISADSYLQQVLFRAGGAQNLASAFFSGDEAMVISANRSAWDIAREAYNQSSTTYVFPDGTRRRGNEIRDWGRIPPGTRVVLPGVVEDNRWEGVRVLGKDGNTAQELAGREYDSATTIYIMPDGTVKTGAEMRDADFRSMPQGTMVLVRYEYAGEIARRRSAFDIAKARWNHAGTIYRFNDGRIVNGNRVNERNIPAGTKIFLPQ